MLNRREQIWNVNVDVVGMDQLIDSLVDVCKGSEKGKTLFCANPHSLVTASTDSEFLSALHSADFLIPDGAGIVLASRMTNGDIRERVSGPDVLERLTQRLHRLGGHSYFFLGSTQETLHRLMRRMHDDFPFIEVKGTFTPAFSDDMPEEENERIITLINNMRPSVVWVGMTAPKQEKWIVKNRQRLSHTKLISAVGAGFDFFSGAKKRSSEWARENYLEWLPRLLREPFRLWRRNIISTPVFLLNVMKRTLSEKNRPR
ncbi:MAG: WecB/TagA/CpsF family glycosyltransferase [Ignavibacteriales bacterium]|nr:WecB/TagA/CpsF family glycosyltransferase [Ignavibacteriales bacterium]